MADTREQAREAIYEGIVRVAGEISGWTENSQAEILKDLAAAYRMTYGGTQPGSAVISKS